MDDVFYAKGLNFECTRCSDCCRGEPGYVFLSMSDLDCLRERFGVTRQQFLERWCRIVDFGAEKHYSLQEKKNNDCIFWADGCSVYEDRPIQCRTYPFWSHVLRDEESWEREGRSCPGIGRGTLHGEAEIEEKLASRRAEGILGPSSPGLHDAKKRRAGG